MAEQQQPLVLLGAGGHAKVVLDILLRQGIRPLACINPQPLPAHPLFAGIAHYPDDTALHTLDPKAVMLINGVGALPGSNRRFALFDEAKSLGFRFFSVICSSAQISPFARLGEGVQIFSHAIVNVDSQIADNVIINTRALVEHDCQIGKHSVLSPAAVLCGQVQTGQQVYIGAGAVVIQSVRIGDRAMVAAGAMLAHDLLPDSKIYPARAKAAGV
jgi:sugar O-acyltransferase (sialic acid O-acetyltransferase NeuD family)